MLRYEVRDRDQRVRELTGDGQAIRIFARSKRKRERKSGQERGWLEGGQASAANSQPGLMDELDGPSPNKTGKQYRLPTEAEWEYSCWGGSQQEYCGSDNVDMVAWYDGNSGKQTHRLINFPAERNVDYGFRLARTLP